MYQLIYRWRLCCLGLLSAVLLVLFAALVTAAMANGPLQMTAGGMQYREILEGKGEPVISGQVARIHLVLWLDKDGQRGPELYNSRADREPVSFVVGSDWMMPALNDGVIGMKPGGRRLLLVPPALAYGTRGLDDLIPADSPVILLVDLIAVDSPK